MFFQTKVEADEWDFDLFIREAVVATKRAFCTKEMAGIGITLLEDVQGGSSIND